MTRLRANSKAASSGTGIETEDKMITEVINGIITTRPAKKIEYLSETKQTTEEPEVIELGGKSKAGSAPVNKLQAIIRFQRSNGRL